MGDPKCKICRRAGVKLFLKGEKCLSQKCLMVKRPYPPGQKAKKVFRSVSEYGKELREKQKLKNWYNLRERQFRKYVKNIIEKGNKKEDVTALLIKTFESRLDNIIFKIGFASSKKQAKQLTNHGHFLVNEKAVNIPSYILKKGDRVAIRPASLKKPVFQKIQTTLKKYKTPSWLELNVEKLEGKVIGVPSVEESAPPVEISSIFEFYSR